VLFLCSGNYYRSRFAEVLFNHRAEAAGLAWRAESRAVDLPASRKYIRGPISPFCLEGLAARGITLDGDIRFPAQVERHDVEGCDLVVAVKEAEHRGPLERLFPDLAAGIEYWHIDDIDCAQPADALALLETAVDSLVGRLANRATS
jgi:protein-tyrosine phosphatase